MATGSVSVVMVFIIDFSQDLFIFKHKPLNFSQIMYRYATITCQSDWREPELALAIGAAHMNMRWFGAFIRIKMKAESPDFHHCRHG